MANGDGVSIVQVVDMGNHVQYRPTMLQIPKTRISRLSRDISLFTWASSFERARLLISRPAISISCVG